MKNQIMYKYGILIVIITLIVIIAITTISVSYKSSRRRNSSQTIISSSRLASSLTKQNVSQTIISSSGLTSSPTEQNVEEFNQYCANLYFGDGLIYDNGVRTYNVFQTFLYQNNNNNSKLKWFLPDKEMVQENEFRNIAIFEDYIYFIKFRWNQPNKPYLYRTKMDGLEQDLICENVETFLLIGNTIYYKSSETFGLYRMDTLGKQKKMLVDGTNNPVEKMSFSNNKIYFSQLKNDSGSFTDYGSFIDLDGSGLRHTKLMKGFWNDGWIYYSNIYDKSNKSPIYRQNAATSEIELLTEGSANGRFTVYNGNLVYLLNNGTSYDIYMMNIENKTRKMIYKNSNIKVVDNINITKEHLYISGKEFESTIREAARVSFNKDNKLQWLHRQNFLWE